jgi:hypothetical protein
MEISVQDKNSLKIRGKHSAVYINPQDKTANYNMAILIGSPAKSSLKIKDDVVVIDGPGEYEAGGIKVSGIKSENGTVYSISLDNMELLLGDLEGLEKIHQKLKEHHVAVVYAGAVGNTSFATSLSMNALLFFGEKAKETVDTLAKDEKKESSKYTISSDKLPTETETILLNSI